MRKRREIGGPGWPWEIQDPLCRTRMQTRAHTAIWGGAGPTMPGEEPEETSVARRPIQLDTEKKDGTRQDIEVDERQETSTAQVVELPLEETEASQPEASTDAHLLTEGSSGEVDMPDQEDSTRITASSPPPRGQGGARQRKPCRIGNLGNSLLDRPSGGRKR